MAGSLLAAIFVAAGPAAGDPLPPQMHTIAGGGTCSGAVTSGGQCDNVKATSVPILGARAVATLPDGGFLYIDHNNNLVRQVSPTGVVQTVAGDGTTTDAADGVVAVSPGSGLNDPVAVTPLPDGGFLITEHAGAVVRVVSAGPPGVATITTIAGTGTPANGVSGSGIATSVPLDYPTDAELTADGRVLIADYDSVRILSGATPGATISTIAGGGACDDATTSCDGMPASAVKLHVPASVSPIQGGAGGYLLAENYSTANAIRLISDTSPSGTFTTVAGTPGQAGGYGGDGGPATSALLNAPEGVLSTADGGFLIADTSNQRIRAVSPSGTITTVAGNGLQTYAGDGGAATAASLNGPAGIAPAPDGGFRIADADSGAIRAVTIPPTTTIVFSPAAPTGANGWYVKAVRASLSVVNGVKSNCSLDPTVPLPVFAALPTTKCPYSGGGANIKGDGVHTLYAASVDASGDQEVPVSASVKIDATPPVVTCNGMPKYALHSRSRMVSATVSDATSGPASAQVSARVPTDTFGDFFAPVVGRDQAGNSTRADCPYTVLADVFKPLPKLTWSFSVGHGHTIVRRLRISALPGGTGVRVSCRGKGCPFKRRSKSPHRHRVDLTPLFAHAQLSPGAQVKVAVTKENTIGLVWLFKAKATRKPVPRLTCQSPASFLGSGSPVPCPAGTPATPRG